LTSRASATGEQLVTTRSIRPSMVLTSTISPFTSTRPSNICLRYSSPPTIRRGLVGARVTLLASLAWTLRIAIRSSMPTWALRRMVPSILTTPVLVSSGKPGQAIAAVRFLPSISMISPAVIFIASMTAESIRAMPLPASFVRASDTRNTLSVLFIVNLLLFWHRTSHERDVNNFKLFSVSIALLYKLTSNFLHSHEKIHIAP